MKDIALKIQHSDNCKRIGFFIAIFIVACLTMKIIPAFQSPDETAHLLRADMLAHGQPLLESRSGKSMAGEGGKVDVHFQAFAEFMQGISGHNGHKDVKAEWRMSQGDRYGWANKTGFADTVGTGYYSPLVYVPHALGLGLSRQLDLSLRKSYELTRAIVALAVFLVIFWAWTIRPPNLLTKALVVMPMSVFQILSPTIDGLCIALTLLLLAIFSIKAEGKRETSLLEELAFYLSIFILATSRVNLLPLVALPVLLLARGFSVKRLLAASVLLSTTFAWTMYAALSTNDTRVSRSFNTMEILEIYVKDPSDFLLLLLRTLTDPEKMGFFALSFVGYLGWLDAPISSLGVKMVWAGIFVCLAITALQKKERALSFKTNISIACLGITSIVMVFFALAITWNDHPSHLISGVQGRYFIIPAMIIAFSLGQPQEAKSAWVAKIEPAAFSAVFAVSFFFLFETLQDRYGMELF